MSKAKRNRSTTARKERSVEDQLKAFRAEQELKAEQELVRITEETEAQATEDLELPDLEFDWSDLGWRYMQEITKALSTFGQMQQYDRDGNPMPQEEIEQIQDEAFDVIRDWFSRVCVSVPKTWFTRTVQSDKFDFTDPDTYYELQEIKVGRLISALNMYRASSEKK